MPDSAAPLPDRTLLAGSLAAVVVHRVLWSAVLLLPLLCSASRPRPIA